MDALRSPSKRMLLLAIGVTALLAADLGVAVARRSDGGRTVTIRGLYTLNDADLRGSVATCKGEGGYRDVRPGLAVSIADADGRKVGSATTRNLVTDDDRKEWAERAAAGKTGDEGDVATWLAQLDGLGARACPFLWEATVPRSDRYEIEFGDGKRGTLPYTADELETSEFVVRISLG